LNPSLRTGSPGTRMDWARPGPPLGPSETPPPPPPSRPRPPCRPPAVGVGLRVLSGCSLPSHRLLRLHSPPLVSGVGMNQGAAGQQAAGGRTLRPAAAAAAHRPAAWHLLHLLFGCPHTLPSPPANAAIACTGLSPVRLCLPSPPACLPSPAGT
jgi:hypothetical protein